MGVNHGIKTLVRNQYCSPHCWFHAGNTCMEYVLHLTTGQRYNLSVQGTIDRFHGRIGPKGIRDWEYLRHFKRHPYVTTEVNYPLNFLNKKEKFKDFQWRSPLFKFAWHTVFRVKNEPYHVTMMRALQKQPIVGFIELTKRFKSLKERIYKHPSRPPREIDHAIAIVGTSIVKGLDYWVIHNSYGESWGDRGTALVRKGVNAGGIEEIAYFPSLVERAHRGRVALNFFDVRTGKVMQDSKGSADGFAIGGSGGVTGVSWPAFKWAGGRDDKYFARIGKSVVSVYESYNFSLIDKKSIKVEDVMDFSWSPTDAVLSLFVPEHGNQPAKVSLIQIPSKEELRQKNLFSVNDCTMYGQSNGDYLAVKVDRYTKTKKSTYTGFELFRIRERDIPIEVLERENKNDKVISFAWEPKGHRFAVIHGDNPRPDVSFYTMKTSNGRVQKLTTRKRKQANALYWSPGGRFILLAGLKNFQGQLEFYNVDELETMANTEHFMAKDVEWDPTGRYVVWAFNGILLYRILKDHFFQGIVRGKLDQFRRCFEVQFAAGRDLRPGQLGNMIQTLSDWLDTSDNLLLTIQEKIRWADSMSELDKKHKKEVEEKVDQVKKSLSTKAELDFRGNEGVNMLE